MSQGRQLAASSREPFSWVSLHLGDAPACSWDVVTFWELAKGSVDSCESIFFPPRSPSVIRLFRSLHLHLIKVSQASNEPKRSSLSHPVVSREGLGTVMKRRRSSFLFSFSEVSTFPSFLFSFTPNVHTATSRNEAITDPCLPST